MPSLLEACRELFGTENLYEVLGINHSAPESEVRRAYRRKSLQVHPDRAAPTEKENFTVKFQTLSKVHSILSSEETRKIYDESGVVDDEGEVVQDRDWYSYWRLLFNKITIEQIDEFEKAYKGSGEEVDDLKSAYLDYEGDMDKILEAVPCAGVEDEPRLKRILLDLIKKKQLPNYKTFTKETGQKRKARQRKAAKEAEEAAELQQELGINGALSLQALIAQRQTDRAKGADNFFAQLEAKYAAPDKKKMKKTKK